MTPRAFRPNSIISKVLHEAMKIHDQIICFGTEVGGHEAYKNLGNYGFVWRQTQGGSG